MNQDAQRIQQHIDELKQKPNSLQRNKTIARLQDALQWAKDLEPGRVDGIAPKTPQTSSPQATGCVCKPGIRDNSCVVHGGQI